jgi:hypothetical protein
MPMPPLLSESTYPFPRAFIQRARPAEFHKMRVIATDGRSLKSVPFGLVHARSIGTIPPEIPAESTILAPPADSRRLTQLCEIPPGSLGDRRSRFFRMFLFQ